MKRKRASDRNDMRSEYDFDYATAVREVPQAPPQGGVEHRGARDPDVAKAFRTSAAVNEALRSLLEVSESTRRLTARSSGRARQARS